MVASYQYQSGGTESSHQLVHWINEQGGDAYIHYYDSDVIAPPEKFNTYNVKVAQKIEDSSENLLIVPETLTYYLYEFHNIKKSIWWLSLNYYLYQFPLKKAKIMADRYNIPDITSYFIQFLLKKSPNKQFEFGDEKNDLIHFYNCEYIKDYLLKNGVKKENTFYLCGPLNDDFFEEAKAVDSSKKRNIVLYNPNKGYFFTKKVIQYAKNKGLDAQFIPLKGLDRNQMIDLYKQAKLYIDFGDFPGPERIPRESVVMKCNP